MFDILSLLPPLPHTTRGINMQLLVTYTVALGEQQAKLDELEADMKARPELLTSLEMHAHRCTLLTRVAALSELLDALAEEDVRFD